MNDSNFKSISLMPNPNQVRDIVRALSSRNIEESITSFVLHLFASFGEPDHYGKYNGQEPDHYGKYDGQQLGSGMGNYNREPVSGPLIGKFDNVKPQEYPCPLFQIIHCYKMSS